MAARKEKERLEEDKRRRDEAAMKGMTPEQKREYVTRRRYLTWHGDAGHAARAEARVRYTTTLPYVA